MSIFAKFNELVNVQELCEGFKNLGNRNQEKKEFKKPVEGKYDVRIEKLELGLNKAETKPMFKCQFRIINGEYKNACLFMNQVMTAPFQIKIVNDFLTSLKAFEHELEFVEFEQYGNLINDVFETINEKYEFTVEYLQADGRDSYKITDVFVLPF